VPSPALKLFVAGTQWIDAFAGRLARRPDPSPRVLGAASLAAIRLEHKNVQVYTGRAISYQKKGDIARAKVDYEKALSLDPDAETSKDVQAALDALGHDRPRIFRRS
jgi:tetratricopeptide (TPR) repeat protein